MSEAKQETNEEKSERKSGKLQEYLKEQEDKLKINDIDLNTDFIAQAPSYVRAAIRFHGAERQLGLEKLAMEGMVGMKDAEIRSSQEKTTEAYIDKAIKADEDVQSQKKRIIDAEYQVGIHQAVMRGWEHKRDMLIQVGACQRAEMTGQVQVNKNDVDQERPSKKNGRETRL